MVSYQLCCAFALLVFDAMPVVLWVLSAGFGLLRQVTQVQFRLQGGRTIARRFWRNDRVSLLFRFVRTTVRGEACFYLVSG